MKRILSLLLLLTLLSALVVSVSAATPGSERFIYDDAQLLDKNEHAILQQKLETLSRAYDTHIVVATLRSVNGGDADLLSEAFFDGKDMGYGDSRDGIMLIVMMDIREFRIVSNGEAADALTKRRIEKITDTITPALSDGDYADAFMTFADECAYYLDGHINGFPFPWVRNLAIALIVGLVIGLIVAFSLKAQLKSVRMQARAHNYVKANSMHLTYHSDLYLYRTVRRTRRENSNSSRSGGGGSGSRNVGGGRF